MKEEVTSSAFVLFRVLLLLAICCIGITFLEANGITTTSSSSSKTRKLVAEHEKFFQATDISHAIPNEYICALSAQTSELYSQDEILSSMSTLVQQGGGAVQHYYRSEEFAGFAIFISSEQVMLQLLDSSDIDYCEQVRIPF